MNFKGVIPCIYSCAFSNVFYLFLEFLLNFWARNKLVCVSHCNSLLCCNLIINILLIILSIVSIGLSLASSICLLKASHMLLYKRLHFEAVLKCDLVHIFKPTSVKQSYPSLQSFYNKSRTARQSSFLYAFAAFHKRLFSFRLLHLSMKLPYICLAQYLTSAVGTSCLRLSTKPCTTHN